MDFVRGSRTNSDANGMTIKVVTLKAPPGEQDTRARGSRYSSSIIH